MTINHTDGKFFAVVGPSGAGKDSLMDGARLALPDTQYVFAKRVVTRPPGQVGETYDSCTVEDFLKLERAGEFLITWKAHGLHYGLRQNLVAEQARGKHIIANCSRQSIKELAETVSNLIVLSVQASPTVLAQRLHHRGRETAKEIERRLQRETPAFPDSIKVRHIDNNGTLAQGQQNFINALQQVD